MTSICLPIMWENILSLYRDRLLVVSCTNWTVRKILQGKYMQEISFYFLRHRTIINVQPLLRHILTSNTYVVEQSTMFVFLQRSTKKVLFRIRIKSFRREGQFVWNCYWTYKKIRVGTPRNENLLLFSATSHVFLHKCINFVAILSDNRFLSKILIKCFKVHAPWSLIFKSVPGFVRYYISKS